MAAYGVCQRKSSTKNVKRIPYQGDVILGLRWLCALAMADVSCSGLQRCGRRRSFSRHALPTVLGGLAQTS